MIYKDIDTFSDDKITRLLKGKRVDIVLSDGEFISEAIVVGFTDTKHSSSGHCISHIVLNDKREISLQVISEIEVLSL